MNMNIFKHCLMFLMQLLQSRTLSSDQHSWKFRSLIIVVVIHKSINKHTHGNSAPKYELKVSSL
jgi:hypothetical protein